MTIEIDGPWWFVGALLICGWHMAYLRSCQRERREHFAWWKRYDVEAQRRHETLMRALDDDEAGEPK